VRFEFQRGGDQRTSLADGDSSIQAFVCVVVSLAKLESDRGAHQLADRRVLDGVTVQRDAIQDSQEVLIPDHHQGFFLPTPLPRKDVENLRKGDADLELLYGVEAGRGVVKVQPRKSSSNFQQAKAKHPHEKVTIVNREDASLDTAVTTHVLVGIEATVTIMRNKLRVESTAGDQNARRKTSHLV